MRFTVYSNDWFLEKLDNVCQFVRDGTHGSFKDVEIGIPLLSAKDIFDGKININENSRLISIDDYNTIHKNYELTKGDILLTIVGTIGRTAMVNMDEKFTLQRSVAILRVNEQISYNFLYYYIQTSAFQNRLKSVVNQSAQGGVYLNSLKKLNIKLTADMNEQNKISSFLSIIDKKIELLEQKYQYYQEFKKYLMQQIFTQKLRFDFDEIRLKSISKINKGKQLNKEHMLEIGKFYVLNGGQEPSGYTDSWNTSENTITISEGGNSCGFVNFNTEKFWSGGHCYYLNKLSENIDVYYLYSYLKFIEPQIMRLRVGSGLPNIQKGDIENIKIKILPKKEQIKISNLLLSTDNKISSIESQKDSFEIFKKGLLQQMFVVQLILSLLQNKKHI